MKKYSIFLGLLFFCAFGKNNQELFLQAHQAFHEGDYTKAFSLYETIPSKGSAVWFNMGICQLHQKKPLEALLFFKRATKNASMSLYLLAQKHIQNIEHDIGLPTQSSVMQQVITRMTHRFSLLFFQCLVLFFLFLLCIGGFYLVEKKRYFIIIMLGVLLIVCVIVTFAKYNEQTREMALVMQDSSLFAVPSNRVTAIKELKAGQEVIIIAKKDNWYKVYVAGSRGWIEQSDSAYI